jgi:hypothetical protein
MKKSNKDTVVLFTLAIANAPLTISELSFRSGKSYNTVKSVVASDERVSALGDRPVRYYFPPPEELDADVVRLQNNIPKDGWVAWIEKIAPKMSTLVGVDRQRQSDDLHKQGIVLEALGINLIQFARELKENADKPDWFTLMGGNENA